MRRLALLAALVAGALVLVGCGTTIPQNASVKAFCSEGEKYSSLEGVPFKTGQQAIRRLAEVGTPAGISASARSGFVELVHRMEDADSGEDFRRATRSMSSSERKHLLGLDDYIQKTCTAQVG